MLTVQSLIDDLASGCKPKDQWRIGLEVERFAFNKNTGKPLPYEGNPGIRQLLENFAAKNDWQVIHENGNPIALKKDGINLTLEPGGQVEYSGSPLPTLQEAQTELDAFHTALDQIATELGIGFLAAGFHPSWTREGVQWMPKGRYDIMRPYMQTKGSLGIDMMTRTCGAQINLDFENEEDMVKKFRVALALQPVVTALMANSSIKEGKDTGYTSYRAHVWSDTDPDRSGIPPFVFDDDMSFARYVDYALDVPMYFIQRDGKYIDVSGQSFRAFMDSKLPGHEGQYPTMTDWHNHLSTLFPEVRLKHYLELRGADSNIPEMVMAMAAFWTGLFYNQDALDNAWNLVKNWSIDDHQKILTVVPRAGLETPTPDGHDLCRLAKEVLPLAKTGLKSSERTYIDLFLQNIDCNTKTAIGA